MNKHETTVRCGRTHRRVDPKVTFYCNPDSALIVPSPLGTSTEIYREPTPSRWCVLLHVGLRFRLRVHTPYTFRIATLLDAGAAGLAVNLPGSRTGSTGATDHAHSIIPSPVHSCTSTTAAPRTTIWPSCLVRWSCIRATFVLSSPLLFVTRRSHATSTVYCSSTSCAVQPAAAQWERARWMYLTAPCIR